MTERIERNKEIEQDWDVYWAGKSKSGHPLYDVLSGIYRRLVVKRILNYFIRSTFPKGSKVLHAGCGSGQVDVDIAGEIDITAMDISKNALNIYKQVHAGNANTVHGSIFSIPFSDNSFDGVYNLGVMEHFTEEEIQSILKEFKRIIRPGGRVLLLWPPVFGFTVFVLDTAHFIMNKILRMNVKLHPEEISRIKSKKHAIEILKKAGFSDIKYYFGIKDVFTQVVLRGKVEK